MSERNPFTAMVEVFPDADAVIVTDDEATGLGAGMVAACPFDTESGTVWSGMGMIAGQEALADCGYPVFDGRVVES